MSRRIDLSLGGSLLGNNIWLHLVCHQMSRPTATQGFSSIVAVSVVSYVQSSRAYGAPLVLGKLNAPGVVGLNWECEQGVFTSHVQFHQSSISDSYEVSFGDPTHHP